MMPSLSVVHTEPSRRRNDAPADSSPPKPTDPSTSPGTNHLNPTGTELLGIAALMYVPLLREIFSTAPLTGHEWLVMAALSPVLLIADEIRKFILRTYEARKTDVKVG